MITRFGKLTASMIGDAIMAMENPHWTNIHQLREKIFFPRDLSNIPAIKWGIDHEKLAITTYINKTKDIVKPTGIWLFPNGIMGASPDGLIYANQDDHHPIAVLEVKCPFSMRDKMMTEYDRWNTYLPYLTKYNKLRESHRYYHQIQAQIHAVDVAYCDLVIWTPYDMLIVCVMRDTLWAEKYLERLEDFYNTYLRRPEDRFNDYPYDTDHLERADERHLVNIPSRDMNSILNPVGNQAHLLREVVIQTIVRHLRRMIYEKQAYSRLGSKWKDAVNTYWRQSINEICESCLRVQFKYHWYQGTSATLRLEVQDIVRSIMDEDCLWGSLFYDPKFLRVIRKRVIGYEPNESILPACTCHRYIS